MKTRNHYLILAAVLSILSAPALAKQAPSLPEDVPRPLIGLAHPQLAGIEQLYVVIVRPHFPPDTDALHLKNLEQSVRDKLKDAHITVAEDDVDKIKPDFKKVLLRRLDEKDVRNLRLRSANIPELRIDIEMITLDDSQQYIFHIQTSLARAVYLAIRPKLGFQADVWKANTAMQAVSVQTMPARVSAVVFEQVEAFIADYRIANPVGQKTADSNDIATELPAVTAGQTIPVIKPTTSKYKYVASKNSKVFHKPDCRWVQRIKPANLVTFSTREQAIQAGKRPCKTCQP